MTRPLVLAFLVLASACDKPAPAVDEAALADADKRALERIVALDVKASQAMRAADDAARAGDAGASKEIVEARAIPAVDEGLRAADGAATKTPWGDAKKKDLVALLRDRRAAMPAYEEAVTDGDPEKMLASIQVQADLERRALTTVAAVKEGR